jgi:hypothetical protein
MKNSYRKSRVDSQAPSRRHHLRIIFVLLFLVMFVAASNLLPGNSHSVKASQKRGNRLSSLSSALLTQTAKASQNSLWQPLDDSANASQLTQETLPRSYATKALNRDALTQVLNQAPMEFTEAAQSKPVILTLPMPDGSLARFRIEESPILEAALAAQYPEIKTYKGQGIDDPTATTRFDWTPLGLNAIILSAQGTSFVEPFSQDNTANYIAYFNQDISTENLSLSCLFSDAEIADAEQRGIRLNDVSPAFVTGATLRTYRLAAAATAEFTQQYGGGSVSTTLTKITTLINQVTAVYQKEATITFQLVANETSIIFTDPATDGYTNGSPSTMLAENQSKLDAVIGSGNYDIGHVFGGITVGANSVAFSGIAGLGVTCSAGNKGRGVSTMGGASSSFPHSIFVNGTTHEIGHQFSARHSFNSTTSGCSGNRDGAGAYEPGSGSTIMAYSICGADNLQSLPDLYFHTGSLEQIVGYAAASGNCAAQSSTNNGAPTIAALSNFTIPANTPFALNGSATDPNADALTYNWEEFDLGAASPPNTDDGTRPIFRSFTPSTSTSRTFPRLQYILNNANVPPSTYACSVGTCLTGEMLPSTTRTMNFRFTARDNRASGGGSANAGMQVSVVSSAGPFAVTQPNTAISWTGGTSHLVTWNVANTAGAPVNAANVKISLSTDGGTTFPTVLLASTANDGSENVLIPNTPNSTARIKIEAVGNIFFDISDANFIITQGTTTAHTDTIGVYRPGLSNFYLRNTNTTGFPDLTVAYGAAGDLPVVGDWDGNGTTTIGLYRPSTSTFYLRNSNSTGFPDITVAFGDGLGGDVPVAGDWDGNGTWTIGVYRPSTSTFYLRNSNTAGFPDISVAFGAAGDLPVVGDWDGNGTMTIGLFRPTSNVFYLRNSNSAGFPDITVQFGAAGDLPVVGDWDGNGTMTIGLFRTSGNVFFLRNSNSAGFPDITVSYGAAGDKAIVGDWDGQ